MSVRGAGTISKLKFASIPKPPKVTSPAIKGPGVPSMKTQGVQKTSSLPSLSVQARRGEAPKVALARAAAGASSTTRKRNPNYPTP